MYDYNKITIERLKNIFVLKITLSILGIMGTLLFYVFKNVKIQIVKSESFIFLAYFIIISTIIFLIYCLVVRKIEFIKIIYPITLIVLIVCLLKDINVNIISTDGVYTYIILAVFFFSIIPVATISYARKLLMYDISRLIFSCENDNTLTDLIRHYDSAAKKAKIAKLLLPFGKDKKTLKSYISELHNKKQVYIKRTILKYYKIIVSAVEIKQLHLSKQIYNHSQSLKNSLISFEKLFDEDNKKIASQIIGKLDLIINFTEKYLGAYSVETKYTIDEMQGQEFEKFCANVLMGYGFYDVNVTKGSGDQGVDIIGTYNGVKYAVQCKRYSQKLGNSPIQEVAAGKNYYKCQGAMVITNNYFTDGAIELAKANDVQLWNRNDLMNVIYATDNKWAELLERIKIGENDGWS